MSPSPAPPLRPPAPLVPASEQAAQARFHSAVPRPRWSPGAPLFLGAAVAGLIGALVVNLLQPEPLAPTAAEPIPAAALLAFWDDSTGLHAAGMAASAAPAAPMAATTPRPAGRMRPDVPAGPAMPAAMAPDTAAAATSPAPAARWLTRADMPLLTLAQLLALKASLARLGAEPASDGSDGATASAEQLLFDGATQRFLQLYRQGGADAAELRTLAGLVDETLARRMQRRELSLAEARALKVLLLESQEDSAELRAAHLVRWTDAHRADSAAAPGSAASAAALPSSR